MNPLARIIAVMTHAGDALYPTSSQRIAEISERERLRNRVNSVVRRDRINHQRLQPQATIESNRPSTTPP